MASLAPPRRVGIVGMGLMGGSVARSLKRLDPPPRIVGFTQESADAEAALRDGVLDVIANDQKEAAQGQDLVIYAAPLRITVELMEEHLTLWGNASVTDVVGLKGPLLASARQRGFADRYVGAHPMVGGTGKGYPASTEGLFEDRTVWLVDGDATKERVDHVEGFWRSLGARTRFTAAEDHDRLMVWASHLPQLVSTALARVLAAEGLETSDLGSGGRDMTRLAMSSSEMWNDLFDACSELDSAALKALETELSRMRAAFDAGEIPAVGEAMNQIREWRRPS